MENWIYFVFASEFIWAVTSLIDKIVLSKNYIRNPVVYIVLNGAMNIFLIFLLPFVGFSSLSLINSFIAISAGAMLSAGIVYYYKAVQHEEISRVLVLWQLVPIFVLLLSFLFLRESLTAKDFTGFLFLISAGILISYKKEVSFRMSKAFWYMMVSAFFISIYYIASKYIYGITNFWNAFFWTRLGGLTGLCVLLVPSIKKQFFGTLKIMKSKVKCLLLFKMSIDFSAFILLGYAMLNGPIPLISALGSSSAPIFIFILTIFTSLYAPKLIKEKIDNKSILIKLFAIALVVIGIIFVNM